jgi:DNA repair photolyase
MISELNIIKGRGAQINPTSPFDNFVYDQNPLKNLEEVEKLRTEFLDVYPKTMLNHVKSPDVPFDYSINPYQGCEHGCVYCYARNTHPYWGYSTGMDFEQKIMVKQNAAKILEHKIKHQNWKAAPIMLSGNSDCYQPIEKKLEITRSILEVLWKYRHPVGIITKNSLILRDLDILKKMASHNLVHVAISITTLNEELRRVMEPRTSSAMNRLSTLKKLADNGIPSTVMMAPIIPGLNDHEVIKMGKWVSAMGALSMNYTLVRLNGDVGKIFENWVRKHFPHKADKILNKIKDCHSGELNDHRFKTRMRGQGRIADIIKMQFALVKKKFFESKSVPSYNLDLHAEFKNPQLKLF